MAFICRVVKYGVLKNVPFQRYSPGDCVGGTTIARPGQDSQPSADGIGGHDGGQEGRRQQIQRVDILLLELDVVAMPVCRMKVHLMCA